MTDAPITVQTPPGTAQSEGRVGVTDGPLAGTPIGTWLIDPMHTATTFAVRHLMSTVRRRSHDVQGQVVLSEDDHASCQVEATITMASVDTGSSMRDDDLGSEIFFDATRTRDERAAAPRQPCSRSARV